MEQDGHHLLLHRMRPLCVGLRGAERKLILDHLWSDSSNRRDDFSRPVLRHGSLNFRFPYIYLPSARCTHSLSPSGSLNANHGLTLELVLQKGRASCRVTRSRPTVGGGDRIHPEDARKSG